MDNFGHAHIYNHNPNVSSTISECSIKQSLTKVKTRDYAKILCDRTNVSGFKWV
jgi:hypothetical protein